MRRDRDEAEGGTQSAPSLVVHPSRHFVPYTGRYYIHYRYRNVKQSAGFNLRFLLHSNGLCVVALDPTNILVQSYANVFRSLPPAKQHLVRDAQRLFQSSADDAEDEADSAAARPPSVPRVVDLAEFCGAFPQQSRQQSDAESQCSSASMPPAGTSPVTSMSDLYALVLRGEAALLPTGVSHTIKGTRGTHNRFDATAKVAGKHKRHASYVQEDMTVCSFTADLLARCPKCGKWQLVQGAVGGAPATISVAAAAASGAHAEADGSSKSEAAQQRHAQHQQLPPRVLGFPAGSALHAPSSSFVLPTRGGVKVPLGINSVLLDVNQTVAESFQFALSDPIGRGFIAVVQPRQDVSFATRYERVHGVAPFVAPNHESLLFVADAFTGKDE